MANVNISIPDQHIEPLSEALARRMDVDPPKTNPERIMLFNAWLRQQAKQVLADHLAQEAAQEARDAMDGW